ncbi:MAG TPA: hypothetical protein VFC56_16545 [Stellaceae bacterium]|nr:hypothetical protein [Stellaceae bacterium]
MTALGEAVISGRAFGGRPATPASPLVAVVQKNIGRKMSDPRKRDDWLAHIRWCQEEINDLVEQKSYISGSTEFFRGTQDIKIHRIAGIAQEISSLEEEIEFARSQIA